MYPGTSVCLLYIYLTGCKVEVELQPCTKIESLAVKGGGGGGGGGSLLVLGIKSASIASSGRRE